jgi:hypothetical protein
MTYIRQFPHPQLADIPLIRGSPEESPRWPVPRAALHRRALLIVGALLPF